MTGHQMNKNKGFTLIELLIVVAIVGIILAVVFGNRDSTKCVGGYVFTNDYNRPTQVLDEKGAGIRCDKQ
jgi:prepilin-type N-terminal cleavage/methylation domain-containing protein